MEGESGDASVPLPSTKRLKALPPPPSKGKEKSEADPQTGSNPTPEEEEERCGICLTGSTQSIRGQIDSCNHHFCFVCVMEWAKIESRCPLCKQRFGSIRRPAVPGLFPSERVVKISERNQASNLSHCLVVALYLHV
jgi:Ring finger domain